ncbi:MAG: SbmA/BacA-like family transporter [Beijerinckiaceae bacterium]
MNTGAETSGSPNLRPLPFAQQSERHVASKFIAASSIFWRDAYAARAWLLTIGLFFSLMAVLAVDLSINRWHSFLFNALEKRDADRAWTAVWLLPLLVLFGAGAGVCVVLTRERLQARWRESFTRLLMNRWMGNKTFRAIQAQGIEPANPEYRMADDVRMALDPLVDFAIGLFSAILGAAAFIGILATIGGSMTLTIGGTPFNIPAFMAIAALIYGVTMSSLAIWIGKPLVSAVANRNDAEARLRFELTRVREHAERVARENEGEAAQTSANSVYDNVVARWLAMIRIHGRLTWITNGSGVLVPLLPLALATPKYLAGDLSLGDLASLAAAFVKVQSAITWLADNFRFVAQWYASAGRVVELLDAMDCATPYEAVAAPLPAHAAAPTPAE